MRAIPESVATRRRLVSILADGIKSAQASRRRDAVEALVRLTECPDAGIVPPLLAALRSVDDAVRLPAIEALRQVAKRDPSVIAAALAPLLKTQDPELREDVIESLIACGPAAVPHLIGLLKHVDLRTRMIACSALAEMFGDAKDAVPDLAAMAKTVEGRACATRALQWIVPDKSFGLLLDALEGDPSVGATLRRIGKTGREPATLLAALLRELRDANPHTRRCAAEALDQLEKIACREHELFYHRETMKVLEAVTPLAAQQLRAHDPATRRDVVCQLIALGSVVHGMQYGLGMMTPLEPGVTLESLSTRLEKLHEPLDALLQQACYGSDRAVRRRARARPAATRGLRR